MGLDSVELLVEWEKWFNISIPNKEAEQVNTVNEAVTCINRHFQLSSANTSPYLRVKDHVVQFLCNNGVHPKDIEPDMPVSNYISVFNEGDLSLLDQQTLLQLPEIRSTPGFLFRIFSGTKTQAEDYNKSITLQRYLDILCSINYKTLYTRENICTLNDIRYCVMGITIDKMGLDPFDIYPESSFTSDLGID